MLKKVCQLILLALIFVKCLFFAPIIFANSSFHTTLTTTYTVSNNGQTTVEHAFKIKNLTPEYFINKYGLKLSNPRINNVRVYHFDQQLTPEFVQTASETSIGINFEQQVVGEGKVNQFRIVYQDDSIAQINGKILEISIPKLSNADDYNQREVKLITPISYGFPQRINPNNPEIKQDGTWIVSYFKNPGSASISALFGEEQVYQLELDYHLENDTGNLGIAQITLPPDTAWQKVNYQSLDPQPTAIKSDKDGNWIATYQIPPNTTTIVKASILVAVNAKINENFPQIKPIAEHFNEQKYWPVNHGLIKQLANEHNDVKSIYDYVVNTLSYTTDDITKKIDRLGAIKALENPEKATCQEFTDLFVSLARAKQIASRRITGYANSNDERLRPLSLSQDILHAWPDYYDQEKKQWIAVDPTWENTTGGVDYFNQFDLNHIVFAINGINSELPVPAGSYKKPDQEIKTVKVEFAQEFPQVEPNFEINLNKNHHPLAFLPGLYELQINNLTGLAWYHLQLIIDGNSGVKINSSLDLNDIIILPYQQLKLPLIIYNKHDWLINQEIISFELKQANYQSFTREFHVNTAPKIHHWVYNPVFLIGLAISSIIFTLIAGSILVFRRKR